MRCPRCEATIPATSRFCPACGAALNTDPANAPTMTSDGPARAETVGGWLSESDSIDHGRFAPGTLLSRRYRIVGQIGRGGMGEVYRADDLRLGQPVALKLLPASLGRDPRRLEQFHNEVRTARTVAHPNVCRVYDIGEHERQLYLSMEFVDGEDLAASLRRVGRFPEDRGLDLARQICAGLGAAHDRGVVHRDLKPANIMVDSQGKVRLMDFGLAAIGEVQNVRAGTPAYMAPEQIDGREATRLSDIYALGLVLYEVFTGRRAFAATTIEELRLRQASGDVTSPTELVRGLDPRIEQAILRCLDREPVRRPQSAMAVAMQLPGTDPLAAALAAGETPSPEMVAAAGGGESAALSRGAALVWLAAALVSIVGVSWLANRATVVGQSEVRKPGIVLAERAEEILRAAGMAGEPRRRTWGFQYDKAALAWYDAHGGAAALWLGLARGRPPVLRFWHRSSTAPLDPIDPTSPVTLTDPPANRPGDTVVELDARGTLLRFQSVAAGDGGADAVPSPDWLRLAGIETLSTLRDMPRGEWHATAQMAPDYTVEVNGASPGGRNVSFEVVFPWTVASVQPPAPARDAFAVAFATALLTAALVILMLWLAVVNVRAGRADWRRAARLAAVGFAVELVRWLLTPAHSPDPSREVTRFLAGTASAFLYGGVFGAAYLGFEPYVRRYWPNALISWARATGGRLFDPLVGRDVLVGIVWGLFNAMLNMTYQMAPALFGWPSPPGWLVSLQPLAGTAMAFVAFATMINLSLVNGLVATFVITLLRRISASIWVVVPLSMLIFGLLGDPATTVETGRLRLLLFGIVTAFVPAIVTMRYGLLAVLSAALASNLTQNLAFTLDPDRAYFQVSLIPAAALGAVVLAAWRLSRGSGDAIISAQ